MQLATHELNPQPLMISSKGRIINLRFIKNIVISIGDKTLRVFTNSRRAPFQYHYDTNTWELSEGDTGENLTKAVLKFCNLDSIEDVIKDYTYKHYMEVFKSQLHNINSKTAMSIFRSSQSLDSEIHDTFIEPITETINNLKPFTDIKEIQTDVDSAITQLYGKGSEEMIKAAITEYWSGVIDYEELSKSFYKYINYIKKYDATIAERLDKQMDVLYKQAIKKPNIYNG